MKSSRMVHAGYERQRGPGFRIWIHARRKSGASLALVPGVNHAPRNRLPEFEMRGLLVLPLLRVLGGSLRGCRAGLGGALAVVGPDADVPDESRPFFDD